MICFILYNSLMQRQILRRCMWPSFWISSLLRTKVKKRFKKSRFDATYPSECKETFSSETKKSAIDYVDYVNSSFTLYFIWIFKWLCNFLHYYFLIKFNFPKIKILFVWDEEISCKSKIILTKTKYVVFKRKW